MANITVRSGLKLMASARVDDLVRTWTRGLRRSLSKTGRRTSSFVNAALKFREPERQLGHVAWAFAAGGLIGATFLPATSATLPVAAAALYLLAVLLPVCAIDSRYGIIPDIFVIALSLGGVCLTAIADLPASIVGAAVVLLAGYLLQQGYRVARGFDGLGFGDVKFLAAACLWVGPDGIAWVLIVGVTSALITLGIVRLTRKPLSRYDALPFGPHLAAALWLTWLFGLLQP